MNSPDVTGLAVALGLGMLVGLQREWAGPHLAGLRTFALITLLGAVAGWLAPATAWLPGVSLAALAALLVAGYLVRSDEPDHGSGLTTAVAALVMYAAGVAIGLGHRETGVLLGAVVAVLLHWKRPLHAIVGRIGGNEIRAIMRLVLIGLIVLPLLPDREYGPYGVLNPFEIWLVVVLICGISLVGYLTHRFLGSGTGAAVGGVLGGVISSTATTVGQARLSRRSPSAARSAAVVIMIASTVVFGRVFAEVAVVAPGVLPDIVAPLGAMTAVMSIVASVLWWQGRGDRHEIDDPDDPLELGSAIVFGLLYALVLLVVALARQHLDERSLYAVAAVSGLTDMDAITLSAARMIEKGKVDADVGWRLILIGAMSNLAFKAGVVAALGNRTTLRHVALAFGVSAVGGTSLLLFWPSA